MKKILMFTLCLVMIIACFTACKEAAESTEPETKTDVSTPVVVDQQPQEEAQAEANVSEPAQEEEKVETDESEDEQEVVDSVSMVESKSVDKNQKTEQTVTNDNDNDKNTHEDIKQEYPTFKSEVALQKWLKGESDSFEEDRAIVLNNAKQENVVTYARPKISKDDNYSLNVTHIETNQGVSTLCYSYAPKIKSHSTSSISVFVRSHEVAALRESHEDAKKDANGEKEYYQSVRHGSIDYYYGYNPILDSFVIYWEQFGFIHSAIAEHVYEQIDQIIPLLELEQVTVKLNDDAVIK